MKFTSWIRGSLRTFYSAKQWITLTAALKKDPHYGLKRTLAYFWGGSLPTLLSL